MYMGCINKHEKKKMNFDQNEFTQNFISDLLSNIYGDLQ